MSINNSERGRYKADGLIMVADNPQQRTDAVAALNALLSENNIDAGMLIAALSASRQHKGIIRATLTQVRQGKTPKAIAMSLVQGAMLGKL